MLKTNEINIRDPFVLVQDGMYYLYGTRGATCWGPATGFDVYRSRDLETWEGPFVCFENDGHFWADRNYWAPEVHVWHGCYYMFASFKKEGRCRGTAILVSDSPMGPFRPHCADLTITPEDWESLDGTFYVSQSGEPYMVFSHEWLQVKDGEICAVKLSEDLTHAVGDPFVLFHASEAPWAKWLTHSSGLVGCVTDGPFMWRGSRGELFCLWASFSESGYTEGVAVSDNGEIDGHFTQLSPLFDKDGGHGMVFRDLQGHLYLTLHSPNTHLQEHPVFLPLMEKGGRLQSLRAEKPAWASEPPAGFPLPVPPVFPDVVLTPEDMGYTGEGLATAFLQAAMDRLEETGGGTLRLRQGDYVSGTIRFRSHVRLEIGKGSRLLASTDLKDFPECHAKRLTVQDTSMGMHQSLIFAEGCEGIEICGPGEICGQGSPASFPGEETAQGTPGRPFVMRVIDCRHVAVHDLTLRDSACWMQNYLNCEDLEIARVCVQNQVNYNNDGLDLDGCRRVWVHDCVIHSGDDGICFKGAGQTECSDVLVENCQVYSSCNAVKIGTDTQGTFRRICVRNCEIGGVETDPSGLKHPWADSGISLEMMDGGEVDRIWMENLRMERVWSPFFMRLENRGRVKPGDPVPGPGKLHHIVLKNIRGTQTGPRGSYFLGSPEQAIESVYMEKIQLRQQSSTKPVLKDADVGRMKDVYPDAHMIDSLGDSPARVLWLRYVHDLTLDGVRVDIEGEDPRPDFVCGADSDLTLV